MARGRGGGRLDRLQKFQSGFCLRLKVPSFPPARSPRPLPRPAPPPPWAGEQRPMGERGAGAR